MFGGEGATVGPDSTPLTAESDEPEITGPCATPPPPGEGLLLDDFEDGDHKVFKDFHREGWWYTATDGSEGETVSPPPSGFVPSALPAEEASPENEMAAHLTAQGMKDWGVSWGTTLSFVKDGLRCPFNASAFDGISFRAKGPGTIVLRVNTPRTIPPELGGVCKERCWDTHAKLFRIKEGWNEYSVRWEQLQQGGWGTEARFDKARIQSINFTADPKILPVDLWIDDLRFLPGSSEKSASSPR